MATPHSGQWALLLSASKCELSTTGPAVHAAVVANPNNGPMWSVTAPANANVAPPGLYMLFVLRPKAASHSGQTAIPSVARIVNVRRPAQ